MADHKTPRSDSTQPTIITPGDGEAFEQDGFGFDWKIDGADTDGRFAVVHHTPFDPGVLAAPLHKHSREDEYSYILEGTMGALLGDEVVEADAGSWVFKPRDQWHTFWNPGDTSCHVIELISPAGFEDYFRELRDSIADPEPVVARNEEYGLGMDLDSIPELYARFDLISPDV